METDHVQQENHLQRDGTPNPLSAKSDPFGQSCAMLTRERQQVGCSRKDATRFVCCMNARGVFVGSDQMTCGNGWGCLKYLEVICPHFESVFVQIYRVKLSNKLRQPLQSKRTPFRAWKKMILASSLRTEHGYQFHASCSWTPKQHEFLTRWALAVMAGWFAHLSNCCEQKLPKFGKQLLLDVTRCQQRVGHVLSLQWFPCSTCVEKKPPTATACTDIPRGSCHQAAKTFRIKLRAFCSKLLTHKALGWSTRSSVWGAYRVPKFRNPLGSIGSHRSLMILALVNGLVGKSTGKPHMS